MRPLLCAVLLLPLAGCSGDAPETNAAPTGPAEVAAPWWAVGEWWDVELERPGASERVRLANFWNDSTSNHFWLGVPDRSVALDHALHDDIPLLGRIHWVLLTPHEKGIHAHGMYTFPTHAGDTFGGLMFGREWEIHALAGDRPGRLRFEGTATDGAQIAYDYDPAIHWFTYIDLRAPGGGPLERIDTVGHGEGARGAFYFLRGRDYYLGPKTQEGTHEEGFDVPAEDPPGLSTLALEIDGRTSGVLAIRILGPEGRVRHQETLAQNTAHTVTELPDPTQGRWTMSFVGTGAFVGTIEVVGVVEYTRTL